MSDENKPPTQTLEPRAASAHASGDIAYHYTTAKGLMGILNNGTLRLTDTRFMNDASEYHFVTQIIRRAIAGGEVTKNLRGLIEKLDPLTRTSLTGETGRLLLELEPGYAFCLSRDKDDINQWRAYCPQNDGYSLGIDVGTLQNAVRDDLKGTQAQVFFEDCVYDNDKQEDFVCRVLRTATVPTADGRKLELTLSLSGTQQDLAPLAETKGFYFLKDSNFLPEQERRLVVVRPPDGYMDYRSSYSTIVPFITVKLPRGCIKEFVVGPNVDQMLAFAGLQSLANSAGTEYLTTYRQTTFSDVPLRP